MKNKQKKQTLTSAKKNNNKPKNQSFLLWKKKKNEWICTWPELDKMKTIKHKTLITNFNIQQLTGIHQNINKYCIILHFSTSSVPVPFYVELIYLCHFSHFSQLLKQFFDTKKFGN